MSTHSSILAQRIPWIEELGGLRSTGLQSRTELMRLSMHACMPKAKSIFLINNLLTGGEPEIQDKTRL